MLFGTSVTLGIGALSAVAGQRLAVIFDTTVGPLIICVAAFIFAIRAVGRSLRRIGT